MESDRYRALVVDDEAAIRKLTVGALRKIGFECDDAGDGDEAARLVATLSYDVVICDLKMPHKNGHALSLEIMQRAIRPLVVVHTGIMEPKLAEDLLKRGIDDIVYKPTDFGLLAAKVKAMVERRPPLNHQSIGAASPSRQAAKQSKPDDITCDRVSLSQLNSKLAEISAVLPVSRAALDVYEMTRNDNWKVTQIGAAIQRDASLVAQVLRLGNSSLYNPSGRRVINLDEAVVRIGQKRVGELALAANALSTITPSMLPWMDLELAWKRSMGAGIALESLIDVGGHHDIEESLLLSAIMHPLGRVALAMLFPMHYAAMVRRCEETGESLREQERHTFPTTHPEIMAHLLSSWRIPSDLFLPLKYALDDFSALSSLSEPTRTRAELVKVAIHLGRLAADRWQKWDFVSVPSPLVLKRLRIQDVGKIIHQIRLDVGKLAEFHAGASRVIRQTESPSIEYNVAYCNPSGDVNDLLREMLPSMGLRPHDCSIDQFVRVEQPIIVNSLSAIAPEIPVGDGGNRIVVVTDHENRDAFDRIGQTAALPDSYARFRDGLVRVVADHSQQIVGVCAEHDV